MENGLEAGSREEIQEEDEDDGEERVLYDESLIRTEWS